jgi:hypothetical protein
MRFIFAAFLLLSLTGCPSSYGHGDPVAVHDKMPVLEEPPRPKLEKMTPDELAEYTKLPEPIRKKLEGNTDKLQIYAEQFRVTLTEYNGFAKLSNQKNGLWIKGGLKDEPLPKDGK